MTNEKAYSPVNYGCNGATVKFSFPWKILNKEDVIVQVKDKDGKIATLKLGSDYNVIYEAMGGEITTSVAYATGNTIVISRNVSDFQDKSYSTSQGFQASEIEKSFDAISCNLQEMNYNIENFKETFSEAVNQEIDTLEGVIEENKQEVLVIQERFEDSTNLKFEEFKTQTNTVIKDFKDGIDAKVESVADASDKINMLDESIELCQDSAEIAVEKAEFVAEKSNEILNVKDELEAEINLKADKTEILNKTQITNCILEVPQKINLTLDNGTLILKKGSKVTVPNGAGVFNEITLSADMNITSGNLKRTLMIFYRNGSYQRCETRFAFSGATAPTSSSSIMLWYDTTNNLVKFTNDGGTTWVSDNISLPFCIVKESNSGWASIDEVFNGFGYIGSTVWADKNAKYLISNGRNIDGTLNNIEYVLPEIRTQTRTDKYTGNVLLAYSQNGYVAWWTKEYYTESDTIPKITYSTWRWLNTKENKMYYTTDSGATWKTATYAILGEVSFAEGKITGFYSKNTFKAVDYNDFVKIPHIVETYKNGTSWYRVYSDGWIEQGGKSATPTTITLLKPYSDTNYTVQITATEPHNGSNYQNISASNLTTTGFMATLSGNNQYVVGIYWSTCGY